MRNPRFDIDFNRLKSYSIPLNTEPSPLNNDFNFLITDFNSIYRFQPSKHLFQPSKNRFQSSKYRFLPSKHLFQPSKHLFQPSKHLFQPSKHRFLQESPAVMSLDLSYFTKYTNILFWRFDSEYKTYNDKNMEQEPTHIKQKLRKWSTWGSFFNCSNIFETYFCCTWHNALSIRFLFVVFTLPFSLKVKKIRKLIAHLMDSINHFPKHDLATA